MSEQEDAFDDDFDTDLLEAADNAENLNKSKEDAMTSPQVMKRLLFD